MEINSHILKFQGKAELPQEVSIGHNYHVSAEGSVTSVSETDNEDGTHNRTYTFKPVRIELLTDKGEMLKLKDPRSNSTLLRSLLYKKWVNAASSDSFEDFYTKVIYGIMRDIDEVVDKYE